MRFSWASVIPLLFQYAVASNASWSPKVKEVFHPSGEWQRYGEPSLEHKIRLNLGLRQSNFTGLENHLFQVSDPNHERYGQHLSKEMVDALVVPSSETISLVETWLATHGISKDQVTRSAANDWMYVELSVARIQAMLNNTYEIWRHSDFDEYAVRATTYSLPEILHDHIDVVQPTTLFPSLKHYKTTIKWIEYLPDGDSRKPSTTPDCNSEVTLGCLRKLYNIGNYTASKKVQNSIGITGYLGQFANQEDLRSFYKDQLPVAKNSSFRFVSVNGGKNSQDLSMSGSEAALDVQYAFGLTFPIKSRTFYSTAGSPVFIPDLQTPTNTNEPYQDWLDFILAQNKSNLPLVVSTSYGDDEQTVPESYARRVCEGFAQLGARGVSLIFSSGDGGVGDGSPEGVLDHTCFSNDRKKVVKFLPAFPASCPYVTSVGGTFSVPEAGVSFSGGGFSDYFPRPSYQDKAIPPFLNQLPHGRYAKLFNPHGRGIPDVSAQATNFKIFYKGRVAHIGGTSASAPTFAGIVALLNDARLRKGLGPLGFLNPALYTKGIGGLNDITTGNNPGCGTAGFNATTGWDPVTGLGTPNFAKLKTIVTSGKY